jgi:hypothetical protein
MELARHFFIVVRLSIGLDERAKDRKDERVVAPARSLDAEDGERASLRGDP